MYAGTVMYAGMNAGTGMYAGMYARTGMCAGTAMHDIETCSRSQHITI